MTDQQRFVGLWDVIEAGYLWEAGVRPAFRGLLGAVYQYRDISALFADW